MSRYHDLYAAFNKAKRESQMPEVRRWHDDECISVCTSLAVAMTAYIEPDSAIQFQYNIETEYTTRRTTLVIGVQLPNLKILHLHIDVSKDKNDYILKLHRTNEEFRISNTTAEDFRPVLQAAYLLLEKLAVAAGQHIHEPGIGALTGEKLNMASWVARWGDFLIWGMVGYTGEYRTQITTKKEGLSIWEQIRMDLKDVFDQIVNRMERAKEKEIRPEITPFPGECTITIPEKEALYSIRLKKYSNGVTINTQLGGKPQHQLMMPGATLQDILRVMQAAIIIVYGKSLH